jgi:HEAT repeats
VPSTSSDFYAAVALAVGVVALLLTALLIGLIVLLRLRLRHRLRREQLVKERWRPVLLGASSGEAVMPLPALPRQDQACLLTLWVYLQESLRGSANVGLNALARQVGLDKIALRLTLKGHRAQRLLGIITLGHLRNPMTWGALSAQTTSADAMISLYAAQALTRIDPPRATALLLPLLVGRQDWSLLQVAALLVDARSDFAAQLNRAFPGLAPSRWERALKLADALRLTLPLQAHLQVLKYSPTPEILVAALRLAAQPALLPVVRGFVLHASWRVRVEAARFLSRFGDVSDALSLEMLMHDNQWWVRYEAARALQQLPFYGPLALQANQASNTDARTRAMITHVLAEQHAAV